MSNNPNSAGGMSLGKIILGVGCGIVLAFVLIVGACSMLVGKAAVDVNKAMEDEKAKKVAALAAIKIKDIDSKTSSGYVTITGRACNEGSEPATFVKIGADFLNKQGQVVDSDFTYASSSDAIQPGACKEFSIMQRNSDDWNEYRVRVMGDE